MSSVIKLSIFLALRLSSFIFLLWTWPAVAVRVTNIWLENGTNPSTRVGRIVIQTDTSNQSGSICDDGWDNNGAIVACRMLGYTNGGTAVTSPIFGDGTFNFLMDDTRCTGDEASLSGCLSSPTSDCSRATDTEAGVICNENLGPGQQTAATTPTTTPSSGIISGKCQQTNPTVRLFGKAGVDGMGFVEVQLPNGTWGFVCDDEWNAIAAGIVCAQLCYPTNYTAKPGVPSTNKLIPTNPVIVLDNVNCAGTESTLQDCPHAPWGVEDCLSNGGELAGVQCVAAEYQPPPAPVPILTCGDGKMLAQFSRAQDSNLEAKHLTVFNQPNCTDATTSATADYVSITIPVNKCGTIVSRNGTHIIYYNEIKYDYTSQEGAITRVNTYRVIITCILPVGIEVTEKIEPISQAVTQSSIGNFKATLNIYRNDSFTNPVTESPVQIPLGEWLNMAVTMEDYDPNLKLVVTDCIASPTGDFIGTVRKVLFANKCSEESSLSFYPLSNFKFGFRFQAFKFVGYDLLYIHCNAIVCLAADNTRECDQTCGNTKPNATMAPSTGRRRRDAYIHYTSATSPAILICDPYAPGQGFCSSIDRKNQDDINFIIDADYSTMKPNAPQQKDKTSQNPQPQEKATSSYTQPQEKATSSYTQPQEKATSSYTQPQEKATSSHPPQQAKTTSPNAQQQEKETNTKAQNQTRNLTPSSLTLDDKAAGDDGGRIISIHSWLLIFVTLLVAALPNL